MRHATELTPAIVLAAALRVRTPDPEVAVWPREIARELGYAGDTRGVCKAISEHIRKLDERGDWPYWRPGRVTADGRLVARHWGAAGLPDRIMKVRLPLLRRLRDERGWPVDWDLLDRLTTECIGKLT